MPADRSTEVRCRSPCPTRAMSWSSAERGRGPHHRHRHRLGRRPRRGAHRRAAGAHRGDLPRHDRPPRDPRRLPPADRPRVRRGVAAPEPAVPHAGVQIMVLCALVLRPLPPEVAARVERFARALGVEEGMVGVARRFAEGTLGLAAVDFERNGYTADWGRDDRDELHTSRSLAKAWDLSVDDPALAARWGELGSLPVGTLGRGVSQLYGARGQSRLAGSAPPLLAQHDCARAGRLRHHRRVRAGGVRPDRPGQRRPAGLLAAGDGGVPVRDGLPCARAPGCSSTTSATCPAPRAGATWRPGSPTA